jgi:hypothetical protein
VSVLFFVVSLVFFFSFVFGVFLNAQSKINTRSGKKSNAPRKKNGKNYNFIPSYFFVVVELF